MDLQNLVTVQYTVNYNQTKLQLVIKELQAKLNNFNQSVKGIDKKLEEQDSRTKEKIQKFQKFTVENLGLALNEVATIKTGLRNYLGDQWVKEEQRNSTHPKPFQSFQKKLSLFNQQANKLHRQVNQLKTELAIKSTEQQEKAQQVTQTINQQRRHLNNIRESIRQGINQKFSQYKKQFQEKNMKEIYKRVQIASDCSMMGVEDEDKKVKNLQKAMRQLKRVSITNKLGYQSELPTGKPNTLKEFQSCGKLIMGKMDFGEMQDVTDFESDVKNQHLMKWNQDDEVYDPSEMNELRMSAGLNFLNHVKPPIASENQPLQGKKAPVLQQQSMQHAINSLRDELKLMIQAETLQFRSSIQALNSHHQKMDASITSLHTQSKFLHTESSQLSTKISDIKNQLQNTKNSVYQNNEKHNQSLARIIELEQKMSRCEGEVNMLSVQYRAFITQYEEQACMRFKDVQNIDSLNGTKYRNSALRNSINTPLLKDDNIFVQRLNLLTEKVVKLQDKMKNGHNGSQKTLPRINSSTNIATTKNGTNMPSMDLLRKDLQNTNENLNKTNQRLQTLKKNLKQLETAHNVIPNRLQKLQQQVRTINQIQQDRLLQLIKQLINRVLADPFNNHFTNTLKKEIHVKFLEIKHEYSSIWKDIQAKVTDRAEMSQLAKLKENVESQNLQIKALVGKKTDNDDFKKGVKYLDGKLKELYSYLKVKETQENSPQGRKYYMGKKA